MPLIITLLLSLFFFYPMTAVATSAAETSLHLDWLDKSVKPSQDFYKFANGNWQKNNSIPAAYARWGTFNVLEERNQTIIHHLLQSAADNQQNKPGSEEQQIGDFYFSGMDEATINKAGISPLKPEFDRINHIKNNRDLQQVLAHFQMMGVDTVFEFGQMQDFKDSRQVIGVAAQGNLGLPDRDYYLKDDAKLKKIRQYYLQHIANMFKLLGDSAEQSALEAQKIMDIETTFAKASLSRIEQRDPHQIYHPMNLLTLSKVTPNFSWTDYFADIGHPEIKNINLAMPHFFNVMNTELKNRSLTDWKVYLRWQLVSAYARFLPADFVNENFRMASVLTGAKELLPRWKQVLNKENEMLGFAIGKRYVEQTFPASSKVKVQEILTNIRAALKNDLKTLSWMTPETRKAAIQKLNRMEERIGYPDQWRNYASLMIDRGPYILNVMRAEEFNIRRELNKIGKPVDRTEWDMTPQTVNAYYDPSTNRINMPAGILQPPFFDPNAPAAVNYGAIGFVMGHEITHGFDDQGAQFDGQGNLKNWWTPTDLKKFRAMMQGINHQFSHYRVGHLHVQGGLVTGEATADLGGLTLAYRAFHSSKVYKQAKTIQGFTPDQQFFIGAAHVWATNVRPDEANRLVLTDPHPPAIDRVNGTLANMSEFQNAYGFTTNNSMVNLPRIVIW